MFGFIEGMIMPNSLKESMIYSLRAGGKRLRPMMVMAVLDAYGGDVSRAYAAASAVEYMHTYSLIHDDLPCMDDDDLRRGKPTNHMVFGEGLATLAGDALQAAAFQVIAYGGHYRIDEIAALVAELSMSAGALGMVGGQVADLEAENVAVSAEQLEEIHFLKTGQLIEFSLVAGAILAEAPGSDIEKLREFAKHVGLAFQIKDDILDVEGHEDVIGKPVGSDISRGKSTYPALLTLDGAKEKLVFHTELAEQVLGDITCKQQILKEMIELVVTRKQ